MPVRCRTRPAGCAALAAAALAAGCFGQPVSADVRPRAGRRLERQREWVEMHPEAPSQIKRAVLGKKLIQGMTTDAVRASWGEPGEVIALGGGDARWTYDRAQDLSGVHVTVEYTLVFNRGVLIRIHRQKYR
jgi:hypothetical protein